MRRLEGETMEQYRARRAGFNAAGKMLEKPRYVHVSRKAVTVKTDYGTRGGLEGKGKTYMKPAKAFSPFAKK